MSEFSRKRVLVIDDAALVRAYYRSALEERGFVVEEALNGLEGLEKLLLQPFDLAIVDINMPQMDGLTFLKSLRRQPLPLGATPALAARTMQPEPHDVRHEQNAWSYRRSPFDIYRPSPFAIRNPNAWIG